LIDVALLVLERKAVGTNAPAAQLIEGEIRIQHHAEACFTACQMLKRMALPAHRKMLDLRRDLISRGAFKSAGRTTNRLKPSYSFSI
jgi:hypothetical protein